MKLVIIDGAFEGFENGSVSTMRWIMEIRRTCGRVHVALWPTDPGLWKARAERLERHPSVWEVHCGRAKDVLPWLKQKEPEAEIKVVSRETDVFKCDN